MCADVKVPREDFDNFYQEFGQVVKQLLQIKEFTLFYSILSAFINWASKTEL